MKSIKETIASTTIVLVFFISIGLCFAHGVNHCKSLYDNNDEIRQCLNI